MPAYRGRRFAGRLLETLAQHLDSVGDHARTTENACRECRGASPL